MNFLTSATPEPSKPRPTGIRRRGWATTAVTTVEIIPVTDVTTRPTEVNIPLISTSYMNLLTKATPEPRRPKPTGIRRSG